MVNSQDPRVSTTSQKLPTHFLAIWIFSENIFKYILYIYGNIVPEKKYIHA